MAADLARGDWQCPNEQCYNHTNFPNAYVYGSSVNCKKCGTGRSAQRPGDWCCPNPNCINQTNCVYGSKAMCPKCGTPKPVVNGGKGGNPTPNLMAHMQAMQAMGGRGGPVAPPREGDWHCANANCKNHTGNVVYSSKTSCPLCGMAKPDSPVMASVTPQQTFGGNRMQPQTQMQMAVGKGARPGDWNCPNPNCKNHMGNVVYGSKEFCPLCNTPRPENGAGGAGGMGYGAPPVSSVPNTRPGDWHCPNPSCKNHTHNVVYAGKAACPLCNTPNPNGDGVQSRNPRSMPY